MKTTKQPSGFSLIEILVGLAIGILGMIVMVQMFSVSESGKRTSGGSDDAQTTGAIAMYSLERDIRQSGYGVTPIRLIGCNVLLPSGVTLNSIAPVTINHSSIPEGDPSTDTLLVVSGSSNGGQDGDLVVSQPAATYPRTYTVATTTSYKIGDQIIASISSNTPVAPCNLTMEPILTIPVGTNNITVATGLNLATNGFIYNMGTSPRIHAYAIRNAKLTQCDFMISDCTSPAGINNSTIWQPVASNIVSLRAQYGRDTTNFPPASGSHMDGTVDVFDQSTPLGNTATTACELSRIFSVRLALVARNPNFEKTEGGVTTVTPTWMGSATTPISLSGEDEWMQYRYKVFQTVVPLRNSLAVGKVLLNGVEIC